MKISETGIVQTSSPDFAAYVAAIIGYGSGEDFEAVVWYIACSLCTDSLCNLPIHDYRELADFVNQHQSQIVACIAAARA
jgi:hypothetical protein